MSSLAIDFGTTHTLAASCIPESSPLFIDPFSKNPQILKSILFAVNAQEWYVGDEALQVYEQYYGEGRYFRSIKKYLPEPGFVQTAVFGKNFKIEDIIAKILATVKIRSEEQTGEKYDTAILGRPAKFSQDVEDDQLAQNRLFRAAQSVGFEEVYFCPEPVAVAYKIASILKQEKILLIADLGGGTSDFTVCKLSPDRKFGQNDVLSMGAISLAGDSFDCDLVRYHLATELGMDITYKIPTGSHAIHLPRHFVTKVSSPADFNLLVNEHRWQVLEDALNYGKEPIKKEKLRRLMTLLKDRLGYPFFREVERVKICLSSQERENFHFDYADFVMLLEIARNDYEVSITPTCEKIMATLDETLKGSGLFPDAIDLVYCTGGTSRLPAIRSALTQRFGPAQLTDFATFDGVIQGLSHFGMSIA